MRINHRNADAFPILNEEPEVAPEWGDQYINVDILLPIVDRMAWGQVVCQKQNANDNPIGRSNQNPILDTHIYIAESMYVQFYVSWNKYLQLEAFINHRKNGSALSVEDQMLVIKGWETLKKSTVGWDICCEWNNGSRSWEKYPILRSYIQSRLPNMP